MGIFLEYGEGGVLFLFKDQKMSVNVEFLTVILPPTPEETYPTGETKVQPKDGESWLPSDSLKTGYAKILIFKAWPLNVTLSFLKRSEKGLDAVKHSFHLLYSQWVGVTPGTMPSGNLSFSHRETLILCL